MKILSTLLLVLLPSSFLFSQVPLTTSNNTLRHGDILCKIWVKGQVPDPLGQNYDKGNDSQPGHTCPCDPDVNDKVSELKHQIKKLLLE